MTPQKKQWVHPRASCTPPPPTTVGRGCLLDVWLVAGLAFGLWSSSLSASAVRQRLGHDAGMAYIIETRDKHERWHRPRITPFQSFAAACNVAVKLAGITSFRIVNVETGAVEYQEIVL